MKKIIVLAVTIISVISCTNSKKKEKVTEKKKATEIKETKRFKASQNYAVVFKWTTKDEKLVEDNAMQQSDQLLKMWKENKIENVYYDSSAKVDKFSYFPNITFFLKAENKEAAEVILNDLVVVKNAIATYSIYPVGNLWLKRNREEINKRRLTKSYVSVWTTKSKPSDEITKSQSDTVIDLWKKGIIENAYFDIEGTQVANNKTDFVFFVNTNTKKEAKSILNKLPFVKNGIATYKLHQVGVFWMGIHNK
ncbi:hypothetical protein [uncultured Tenacibaculum sp.]|uniref:hypothetical protein n=1 Tax=uncultured Tenacibaculum sp. TaxID=174713 RepID=UPI0026099B37|nr:hypothetical protein [uncultured Tenacibaculum sp.]